MLRIRKILFISVEILCVIVCLNRTVAYACAKLCERQFCCESYAGDNCEQVSGSRYVRLVNGSTDAETNGILQLYENGRWFTMCADSWNDIATDVACRSLGYRSGFQMNSTYYQISDVLKMTVDCHGNETDLSMCGRSEAVLGNSNNCITIVAISCSADCRNGHFGKNCIRCNCNSINTKSCDLETGDCYCKTGWTNDSCGMDLDECESMKNACPDEMVCTNTIGSYMCSCKIGYTEVNGTCKEVESSYVRLTDVAFSKQTIAGSLQIYHRNDWWNVCALNWDVLDTHIACRSLGYMSGLIWTTNAANGRTGYARCNGNETDIGFCVFHEENTVPCSKVVLLFCSSVCRDGFYGDNCTECFCNNTNKRHCDRNAGTCSCRHGGTRCNADADECEQFPDACAQNMNCVNTLGSYACSCNEGFKEENGICKRHRNGGSFADTAGALGGTAFIIIIIIFLSIYICFFKRNKGVCMACKVGGDTKIREEQIPRATLPSISADIQYNTIGELGDYDSLSSDYAEISSVDDGIELAPDILPGLGQAIVDTNRTNTDPEDDNTGKEYKLQYLSDLQDKSDWSESASSSVYILGRTAESTSFDNVRFERGKCT